MQKNKRQLRLAASCLLFIFCLALYGCWDRHELQDRNFVLAVGIDTADAGLKPGQAADASQVETFTQPHGNKRYRVSVQVLKITGSKDPPQKKASKTFVISDTGQSLFEIIRDLPGQTSKSLWWEHVQTIVISEAAVKQDNLQTLLDFFLRDSEMRSRIKVFITPGEARPILEYQPKGGDAGGIYLSEMSQNHANDMHIVYHSDLGFTQETLANNADALIPRLELTDKVLKLGGSAAFRQGQFIGYLDDYATMGIKLLRGSEKNATLTITSPDQPQNLLVFQAFRHDTSLTPRIEGEHVHFVLDIHMVGYVDELQGDTVTKEIDTLNPADLRKLELLFAQEIQNSALYAWQQLQDIKLANLFTLHFDAKLKSKDLVVWRKLKDHWYDEFPNIPLTVSANITIRGIGKHK
ncbi:MAG: Ger(x)C family spore germination protein [Pelosinus sp.]|nr:Ger(x)C family spore germination protein [Pelosinus sp.]